MMIVPCPHRQVQCTMEEKHLYLYLMSLNRENPLNLGILGCANKDLWGLCAPIFIIVVYCRTATSYFLGGKE